MANDVHELHRDGARVMFHIPTSALFELDAVSGAVLDRLRAGDGTTRERLAQDLSGRFSAGEVDETLAELGRIGLLDERARAIPPLPQHGLTTLVLNVNTGCNLSCSYCYKEDLAAPVDGERMDLDTARRSIDLLLAEAAGAAETGGRKKANLVFFGGEPLTNMALIRAAVDYAEQTSRAQGIEIEFSLTTNATLLTPEIIDYFNAHRFGLTISMDGPRALHDKNRKTVGGQGTYDVVAEKVRLLLSRYSARPVGARVTLTPGVTDVRAIHDHLRGELGFFEVGYAPATAGDDALFNLSEAELAEVFAGFKALGQDYLEAALAGHNNGFGNMHQLMTDLVLGTRKLIPCGAGVGMLAVDKDGDLHLCHRFTGSKLGHFGSVEAGIDRGALESFISGALDREGRGCSSCRIRNLCSGGCYHESYARSGDPLNPTYHYCDILRDWVDFGIEIFLRINAQNPSFFDHHVMPRRATS
jgi:uncharacterized protein